MPCESLGKFAVSGLIKSKLKNVGEAIDDPSQVGAWVKAFDECVRTGCPGSYLC